MVYEGLLIAQRLEQLLCNKQDNEYLFNVELNPRFKVKRAINNLLLSYLFVESILIHISRGEHFPVMSSAYVCCAFLKSYGNGTDHYILVLDVVCEEHGLEPCKYVLSYKKTFLDNDDKLEFLGIPDESLLELIKDFRPRGSESVCVTLKVKDTFCSAHFHPEVPLWTVVRNLVASDVLDIPSSTPAVIYEGKEYIGSYVLNELTLRDVGMNQGHVKCRFMLVNDTILSKRSGRLRSVDSLIYESAGKFKIRDTRMASSTSLSGVEPNHVSFHPGVKARGSSILEEIHYLEPDRKVIAFRIPENLQRIIYEPEDDFYDLTLIEVKMLYKQLQKKRKELEEKPFMTKAQRDELEKEKEEVHSSAIIRVEFPDRTVLQAVFSPHEKIKDVEEVVSQYIRIPTSFSLFTAPPKEILEPEKTLLECRLVPTGKVFYKINEGEHPKSTAYLKEDVLRGLTSHEAACHAAALCRSRLPSIESLPSTDTFVSQDLLSVGSKKSILRTHSDDI